jgi:hypothetical protein
MIPRLVYGRLTTTSGEVILFLKSLEVVMVLVGVGWSPVNGIVCPSK